VVISVCAQDIAVLLVECADADKSVQIAAAQLLDIGQGPSSVSARNHGVNARAESVSARGDGGWIGDSAGVQLALRLLQAALYYSRLVHDGLVYIRVCVCVCSYIYIYIYIYMHGIHA
jgi:hypothetical protein